MVKAAAPVKNKKNASTCAGHLAFSSMKLLERGGVSVFGREQWHRTI
jgi:hypothetical protein